MGLLLLVALVLAWPTFGISLLAWIAFAIWRSQARSGGSEPELDARMPKRSGVRRDRIVEDYLHSMIASGTSELDAPELYFEAACAYAKINGGVLYEDMRDCIIFDKVINGTNYSIFFMVGRGRRGTNLTVNERQSSLEIATEEAERIVTLQRDFYSPSSPTVSLPARGVNSSDKSLKIVNEQSVHLERFFESDLSNFFLNLGVPLKDEDGKMSTENAALCGRHIIIYLVNHSHDAKLFIEAVNGETLEDAAYYERGRDVFLGVRTVSFRALMFSADIYPDPCFSDIDLRRVRNILTEAEANPGAIFFGDRAFFMP